MTRSVSAHVTERSTGGSPPQAIMPSDEFRLMATLKLAWVRPWATMLETKGVYEMEYSCRCSVELP